MSRDIDLSQPLSDEDRAYLEARNRYSDIAIADGDNPPSPLPADGAGDASPDSPHATDPSVGARTADLPTTPLPVPGGSAPVSDDGSDDGGNAPSDDGENYDDDVAWSYSDLQAEAKERGLSAGGSREEIIERLREDDAKPADDSGE